METDFESPYGFRRNFEITVNKQYGKHLGGGIWAGFPILSLITIKASGENDQEVCLIMTFTDDRENLNT